MAIEMQRRADLHVHTTASDGMFAPAAIVQMAKKIGLAAIAITDHDTTAGVEEALRESEQIGVKVIPGVELSTSIERSDIHVLAYNINVKDERWQERLATLRNRRDARNEQIVHKLVQLNIPITLAEIYQVAKGSEEAVDEPSTRSIGRPHIANVLVRKGIVESMQEAFDRYLIPGAPSYVQLSKLHPEEAFQWIKQAGGVSVIAHPKLYQNDDLVERLIKYGVDGIEIAHADHTLEDEHRYHQLARRYGLIETGGSDFHGIREGVPFHSALGSIGVDLETVDQLIQDTMQE